MANAPRTPAVLRGGPKPDYDEENFHIRLATRGAGKATDELREALAEVNPDYAALTAPERKQLEVVGDILEQVLHRFVRPVVAPRKGRKSTVGAAMVSALLLLKIVDFESFKRRLIEENRHLVKTGGDWRALKDAWQELLLDEERALYELRWITPNGKAWETTAESEGRLAKALAQFLGAVDGEDVAASDRANSKAALVVYRVVQAGGSQEAFESAVEAEQERLAAKAAKGEPAPAEPPSGGTEEGDDDAE